MSLIIAAFGLSLMGFFYYAVPQAAELCVSIKSYWQARRDRARCEEQWPEALLLMASGLRAGLTLEQALQIMVAQSPEPLRASFIQLVGSADAWVSVSSRLDQLFSGPDKLFLRKSCHMAQSLGAPLAGILISYARQMRKKRLFRQKVMAMTAQSRMTAKLVALAPVVFGIFLALFSPEFITPFFNNSSGRILLGVVAVMNAAGFWVIQQMMKTIYE